MNFDGVYDRFVVMMSTSIRVRAMPLISRPRGPECTIMGGRRTTYSTPLCTVLSTSFVLAVLASAVGETSVKAEAFE